MPHNAFSKVYLHITWHTKNSEPIISPELQKSLYSIIKQKCNSTREVLLIKLGGTENHIHLAVKVPPSLCISKWIGELKGASLFSIKRSTMCKKFNWQKGYGVVSFSEKNLNTIINYIDKQHEHHSSKKLDPDLEKPE